MEFLLWLKSFWDANYPGGEYNAVSRRMGTLTLEELPAPIAAHPSPLLPESEPTPYFDTSEEEIEFLKKKVCLHLCSRPVIIYNTLCQHRIALNAGRQDDDTLRRLQALLFRP